MRKRMGNRWAAAAVPCLLLGLATEQVSAQEVPYDPAIDVQLFDMAPGPRSFMSVADGQVSAKGQLTMDFMMTFLTDPFVIYNVDEGEDEIISRRTDVVSSIFAGQLVSAYGLMEDLQLSVSLPLTFSMSGDGLDPATGNMAEDGIQATGFGDLTVQAKGRILRNESISAAWFGGASVPTSFGVGGSDYLGDDLPYIHAGASAHWQDPGGKLRVGASAAGIFRKPRTIYATEVGQQLRYGIGASFAATDKFSLIGETFGRTALTSVDLNSSPLEIAGGVRAKVTKSTYVTAGGGAGLVQGIGSPGLRFLVSVGLAPDTRDSDKDGISNNDDACPLLPEDMDGFEDSDGCPDEDNDKDLREDSVDKCPLDKEDLDGFQDEDGCPEPDNDGDNILDENDKCPNDAEDGRKPFDTDGCPANKRDSDDDGVSDLDDLCPEDYEDEDGFEDWDGCPEEDNDKDGLADEDDQCPLCPEDADGYRDEDGCPDPDNDKDGIADSADKCPDERETFNGNADEDGCPDGGRAVAELDGARLVINEELKFRGSNELRNTKVAEQIGAIMASHRDVTAWRVVVVSRKQRTPEQHKEKSQAQADNLKAALVAGGMDADRIEAIGAASDNETIAIVALERSDEEEEGYCPAELEVQPREKSETPAAAPQPEAAALAPAPAPMEPAIAAEPVDTDGDGLSDQVDQCPDQPETANSYQDEDGCPDEVPKKLKQFTGSIKGINFKTGSAEIKSSSMKLLKKTAKTLKEFPELKVEISGHTDNVGDHDANKSLSQARADAVRDALVAEGLSADMFVTIGFGDEKPIADNKDRKGRKANRRIEFRITAAE